MAISQVDPGMAPYQILDAQGKLVGKMPDMSAERLLSLYRYMQLGRAFSNKIVALQRQGRATTFGSLVGQEATAVGLAAPLQAQDWLTTSYREIASLVVRGMPCAGEGLKRQVQVVVSPLLTSRCQEGMNFACSSFVVTIVMWL